MPVPTLNDLGQSLMAKVLARKTMYKVNGLLCKKEEDEEEEEETRATSVREQNIGLFRNWKGNLACFVNLDMATI